MEGSANLLRSTFSEPLSPPLPIDAGLDVGAGTWFCQFDRPIKPGVINHDNWFGRFGFTVWTATAASVAGDTVSGAFVLGGEAGGGSFITYDPPPFDVASRRGPVAAGFVDFPLTVT